jgi:hypothetical protein
MTVARFNLYRDVHKGLRLMLSELVERAGRTDFHSALELTRLGSEVEAAFDLLKTHARLESIYLGPLLAQHSPRLSDELEVDHEDQEVRLQELSILLGQVDPVRADALTRGHEFCVRLARTVGELLVHMSDEEERAMPALWKKLSDESLARVGASLMASVTPEVRAASLKWMLRALNRPERLALLARMRQALSSAAFADALESVRAELEESYVSLVSDLRLLESAAA